MLRSNWRIGMGRLLMHRGRLIASLAFVVYLAALPSAKALDFPAKSISIEWKLDGFVKGARGEVVHAVLVGTIPEGYHTFSTKQYPTPPGGPGSTGISLRDSKDLTLEGEITYPAPILGKDSAWPGVVLEEFEKTVTFTVPLKINPEAQPGDNKATFKIASQLCDAQNCRMKTKSLEFPFTITSEPVVKSAPVVPPAKSDKTDKGNVAVMTAAAAGDTVDVLNHAKKEGLLAYLSVALASGALALLTPCVFPMIPITVSFFTKRKQVSRARSLRDAGIYSLGIIFTFIGLGFLFALLLGASGINQFAANPWVNLGVAAIFIGLAGSLFGFYEIQLPSGMLSKLNASASQGDGVGSLLLMGLVFSLTSFTCTVPFVGAVMVAATQGDWVWPFLGMLVFSSVFASPFFLLALFPAALKSLPKSGGWLNSVKVVMGFLEIAASMKFLSNADLVRHWGILTREVFLVIWIVLSLMSVLYLLGKIKFAHDTKVERFSRFRWAAIAGFAGLSVYLVSGLFGVEMGTLEAFIPPPAQTHNGSELTWLTNWDSALEEAKKSNKPIFIDFTGYTCANCRKMEQTVFPLPEVIGLMKNYIRVRLYTDDKDGDKYQAMQQERFGTVTLPFYVTLTPDNMKIETFDGYTTNVPSFTTFLNSGIARKAPAVAEIVVPKVTRKIVIWDLDQAAIEAAPDETTEVHLTGKIPAGWHTYSMKTYAGEGPQPTLITVEPADLVSINGKISHPEPLKVVDAGFKMEVEEFEDSVTFTVPIKIQADAKPGKYAAKINVKSQICKADKCMPATVRLLEIPLTVKAATRAVSASLPDQPTQK